MRKTKSPRPLGGRNPIVASLALRGQQRYVSKNAKARQSKRACRGPVRG